MLSLSARPTAASLPRRTLMSLAVGLAFASSPILAAEAEAPADAPVELDKVTVEGQAESGYKPPDASSPKYTAPLRDTPQTITIVPASVIKDQNLLSLRDILSTVPGITFAAGEGGGGFGDGLTLRGYSASNDIGVDGVRDSAQYSRSDSFNLEQVEVVNGAASVYSGVGAVGGSVNLVTKMPTAEETSVVSAALGTDNYTRVTADSNVLIGDETAVRMNLMGHKNDVPGRDVEEVERFGLAPSVAFGLGSDTRLSLSALYQRENNIPEYGVPYYDGAPLIGVDSATYYGYTNLDDQDIEVGTVTAKVEHDFSAIFKVRNLTRWQEVTQDTQTSAPQGTFCFDNGLTPSGDSCGALLPATYQPSGPRGLVRETDTGAFVNQTDFTTEFTTGRVEHTVVTGASLSSEDFALDSSSLPRNADGTALSALPVMDLYEPSGIYTGPINKTLTAETDTTVDNMALYLFDTLAFGKKFQLSGGVRYDRNEAKTNTVSYNWIPPVEEGALELGEATPTRSENDEDMLSYRLGAVYKPRINGSVYVAYGNSETPSTASVRSACNDANCTVEPEEAESYEVGTKWDVLHNKLALTASLFRNDRTNYRVTDSADFGSSLPVQQLDGEARVDGVALSAGGALTKRLQISANYTWLDSEVLRGVSKDDAAVVGDYMKGDALLQVPDHAFSVWATYEVTTRWEVGYGTTYQGETWLTQHSASYQEGPLMKSPDYFVHRAMVSYVPMDVLVLQLNVENLFDEEYYTRIRPGSTTATGWATPGAGISAVLSASYRF